MRKIKEVLRLGAGATGDRTSLFDQLGGGALLPEESSGGRGLLGVAGKLGRAAG